MGNNQQFKHDTDAVFFYSPLTMKNGKRKLKRFQAGVWFPHATGAEWDEHIGRRARILKAIAEEQRQSDVQARELMFEASQECKQVHMCVVSLCILHPTPESNDAHSAQ
jgi:hypothetical protein